jgi:peptidoglycan/xylan/chitin deacetylase (PgdA/CDA1 family)
MKTTTLKNFLLGVLLLITIILYFLISTKSRAAENNLIKNPSVETVNPSNNKLPLGWSKDFYGTNSRIFTYPISGQDGEKALKVELTKRTSGDAKWVFQNVAIIGGQKYKFTDYYQSNINSYLVVRYKYKSGAIKYFDITTLNPVNTWTENNIEITTPKNATLMTVYHLIKNVGWLATDNFSLSLVSNNVPTSVPTVVLTSTPTETVPTNTPIETPVVTDTPTVPTPTDVETQPTNTPTEIPDEPTPINPTETPEITPTIDTPTPTTETQPTETPVITDTPTVPTPTDVETQPTNTPTEVPVEPTITDVPTPIDPTETPEITPTIDTPTPTTEVQPTETPVITDTPTPTPTSPTPTTIEPTPTSGPVNNLGFVINGDFENTDPSNANLPLSWNQGNWGTNSVIFTYPVAGFNSSKAAKVDISQITDGDAKWYFADVSVNSGSTYLFADNYISNVNTRIVAQYKMSDGTYSYQEIGTANPSNSWGSISYSITPPTGVVAMTVFHLLDKVGNLTLDNVSLQGQISPHALTSGMVSLDFDDGWSSTIQNGLPIVNGAGFKSTLYIISQYMGADGYASTLDILAAQSAGNEIGAHSKTHPQLPLLTETEMQNEIAGSRQDLLSIGASPVNSFSYPYGEYNSTIISMVQSAGYKSARTALYEDGGFNDKNTNPILLKTQSVENTTTLEEIQSWIDTAVRDKTWLILVMHQVDNSGGQYSITPAKLQSIVNYLKNNNVKVVTASEGVSYLK